MEKENDIPIKQRRRRKPLGLFGVMDASRRSKLAT
jgi:hypothetical protein